MVTAGATGEQDPAGPRSPLGESRPLRAGRLGAVPGERGDTVRDRGGRRPTEHHVLQLPEPAPTLQARRRAGRPRRRRSDRHHRRARLGRRDRRSSTLHPAHAGRTPGRPARARGSSTRRQRPGGRKPGGTRSPRVWPSSSCGWAIRCGRGWPVCPAPATGTSTPSPPGWSTLRPRGWRPRCGRCRPTSSRPTGRGGPCTPSAGCTCWRDAHQQLDDLPEELAATVRSRVGYPVSKETVRGRPAVLGSLVGDRGASTPWSTS